jgi:hypothetical protein
MYLNWQVFSYIQISLLWQEFHLTCYVKTRIIHNETHFLYKAWNVSETEKLWNTHLCFWRKPSLMISDMWWLMVFSQPVVHTVILYVNLATVAYRAVSALHWEPTYFVLCSFACAQLSVPLFFSNMFLYVYIQRNHVFL